MSEKSKDPLKKFFQVFILMLFIVFLYVFFLEFFSVPINQNDYALTLLSIFLLLILFTLLIRSLTKTQPKSPQKILTLIQCTKCTFKSVRDFQIGDYIPKIIGPCPNCGSTFQIEAIYVEEPVKKESKEPLTF